MMVKRRVNNFKKIVVFASVFFLMLSLTITATADIYMNYTNSTGSKLNYSFTNNTSKLPSFLELTGGDIEMPSVTLKVYINNVILTSGSKSLALSSGDFGSHTTSDFPKQKIYVANSGRAIVNYSVKAHSAFANYAVNISTYKEISNNVPFYSDLSEALLDFDGLKNKWSSNSKILNELENTTGDSNLENETSVTLDESGDYNGSLNLSAGNYLILVTTGTDPKQIITSTIVKVMPFDSTITVPTTGTIGSDVSVSVSLSGAPLENYTYISNIIKWTDYNNDIGNINISWTSGKTLVESVRINGTLLETANSLTDIIPRSDTAKNTTNSTTRTLTLNTASLPSGSYLVQTVVFNSTNQTVAFNQSRINLSAAETTSITTNSTIPGLGANESNSSEVIFTELGNFSYTIIAGPNGTSAANLSVTVQVNPPANVSYQINATTGGLGAGAIPSLYFNYSVDDPKWYDNISYIHIRMYYDQSAIPSNVDESTLRPARYISNTTSPGWVNLECGTCPRTLEILTDPDGQNRSVILKASGVNTTDNYVWANVTHYSSYGVAGTVTSTPSGSGSGGGGGGSGGGGGGKSDENSSNIDVIEKYDLEISKGVLTSYRFKDPKNPIMFVNITGNASLGVVTGTIEVLKGTSALVNVAPDGLVYKNANIWIGTRGMAVPKNIKEALIKFKVDNTWMSTNGVEAKDIVLVKWDGSSWIQLETKVLSKDDTNTYLEGKTNSFSPFAITAKLAAANPTVTIAPPSGSPTPADTTPAPAEESSIMTWIIGLVILVIIGAAVYFLVVKKNE